MDAFSPRGSTEDTSGRRQGWAAHVIPRHRRWLCCQLGPSQHSSEVAHGCRGLSQRLQHGFNTKEPEKGENYVEKSKKNRSAQHLEKSQLSNIRREVKALLLCEDETHYCLLVGFWFGFLSLMKFPLAKDVRKCLQQEKDIKPRVSAQ